MLVFEKPLLGRPLLGPAKINIYLVILSHFVSVIISSHNHLPLCQPISAFAFPPLPFVSQCFHLPYPPSPVCQQLSAFWNPHPSLAADITCEQPLLRVLKLQEQGEARQSRNWRPPPGDRLCKWT